MPTFSSPDKTPESSIYLSLNGHLYKTDTSVKQSLIRVGPCLSLLHLIASL